MDSVLTEEEREQEAKRAKRKSPGTAFADLFRVGS